MKRWSRNCIVGLLVSSWLSLAGVAKAGPYVNLMQPCDCPPNHYSAMHVLMPSLWRWAAWCQGPCHYTFARTLHPDLPPTSCVVRYHCPSVNPLQFSLANYPGLNGSPAASTYQAPAKAETPQGRNPPQELPIPRQEKGPPAEKLPPPNEEAETK
jgi:hypothetical protein